MACKHVERFKQNALMWQTKNRRQTTTTKKWVAIA